MRHRLAAPAPDVRRRAGSRASAIPSARASSAATAKRRPSSGAVGLGQVGRGDDVLARHEEDVGRRPRGDVADGDDEVVVVDRRRRDLPGDDPAEEAVGAHAAQGYDGQRRDGRSRGSARRDERSIRPTTRSGSAGSTPSTWTAAISFSSGRAVGGRGPTSDVVLGVADPAGRSAERGSSNRTVADRADAAARPNRARASAATREQRRGARPADRARRPGRPSGSPASPAGPSSGRRAGRRARATRTNAERALEGGIVLGREADDDVGVDRDARGSPRGPARRRGRSRRRRSGGPSAAGPRRRPTGAAGGGAAGSARRPPRSRRRAARRRRAAARSSRAGSARPASRRGSAGRGPASVSAARGCAPRGPRSDQPPS